jgi:hypothetical protein
MDLPGDAAAICEAGFAQEDLSRADPNRLTCINVWGENGRRVARIATASPKPWMRARGARD